MRIVPLAELKAKLSAYLDECATEGPIVITRNGKTAAVLLVPRDDDDLERILLGRSPRFQAMLDRSRRTIDEGQGLSEADFWKAARKRRENGSLRPTDRPNEGAETDAGPARFGFGSRSSRVRTVRPSSLTRSRRAVTMLGEMCPAINHL